MNVTTIQPDDYLKSNQQIMRNLFHYFMIIAALSVSTLLVSCGDDEPGVTPAPVITEDVFDDYVSITAKGEGKVKLYFSNMEETTNPTLYFRDFQDYTTSFAATAKAVGKSISKTTTKDILIPKTIAPIFMHAYSVIENENDSTFFEFDFNLNKATGKIGVMKTVFEFSGGDSYEISFSFDIPVSCDKTTGTYSCQGSDITPSAISQGYPGTLSDYTVTDLNCKVCAKDLTYTISFDCHGKHFNYSGTISKVYPIVFHATDGSHIVIPI